MKSPARSFARALLIGVVALIPAVMIGRPASSGDNGPAAQAAGRDELFRPGAVRDVRGAGPGRGRLPARRHRHGHGLARRPRQPPRLGDLQPARQGRPHALHLLRPVRRAGRDEARPRPRGAARAAVHDGLRLPPRLRPGTAAHGEGPLQGRVPVRRGRALRSRDPARDHPRGLQSVHPPRGRRFRHPGLRPALPGEEHGLGPGQDHDRRLGRQPDRLRRRRRGRRPRPRQVRPKPQRDQSDPVASRPGHVLAQGQAGGGRVRDDGPDDALARNDDARPLGPGRVVGRPADLLGRLRRRRPAQGRRRTVALARQADRRRHARSRGHGRARPGSRPALHPVLELPQRPQLLRHRPGAAGPHLQEPLRREVPRRLGRRRVPAEEPRPSREPRAGPSTTPSSPRPCRPTSSTPCRARRPSSGRRPASGSKTGTTSASRAAATSRAAARSTAPTSGTTPSRWPSSSRRSSGRCARPTS